MKKFSTVWGVSTTTSWLRPIARWRKWPRIRIAMITFQTFMPEPIQPSGHSIIYRLSCEQCDFDTHGTEVRSKIGGSLVRKSLDAEGRFAEEITENEEGEATYRTLYT